MRGGAPRPLVPQFEKGYPIKVTDHPNGVTVTDALELFIYLNKVRPVPPPATYPPP